MRGGTAGSEAGAKRGGMVDGSMERAAREGLGEGGDLVEASREAQWKREERAGSTTAA